MKSRTTLYTALTRLLTVDVNEDLFEEFMQPITGKYYLPLDSKVHTKS